MSRFNNNKVAESIGKEMVKKGHTTIAISPDLKNQLDVLRQIILLSGQRINAKEMLAEAIKTYIDFKVLELTEEERTLFFKQINK